MRRYIVDSVFPRHGRRTTSEPSGPPARFEGRMLEPGSRPQVQVPGTRCHSRAEDVERRPVDSEARGEALHGATQHLADLARRCEERRREVGQELAGRRVRIGVGDIDHPEVVDARRGAQRDRAAREVRSPHVDCLDPARAGGRVEALQQRRERLGRHQLDQAGARSRALSTEERTRGRARDVHPRGRVDEQSRRRARQQRVELRGAHRGAGRAVLGPTRLLSGTNRSRVHAISSAPR
jgi:hypothetical protein